MSKIYPDAFSTPPANGGVHVVDPDSAVRDSIRVLIETAGHPVETYPSGIELRRRPEGSIAGCVVLDSRALFPDGLTLPEALKEFPDDLPVIVIAGISDVALAVASLKAGAFDFLEKPFSPTSLLLSVRAALSRPERQVRQHASPLLARLTVREHEVLERLVQGDSAKAIAKVLAISPRTAEVHRAHIMEKLSARNLADLVRIALGGHADVTPGRSALSIGPMAAP